MEAIKNTKPQWSNKHTTTVCFENFDRVLNKKNRPSLSSLFWCHGYRWKLEVTPPDHRGRYGWISLTCDGIDTSRTISSSYSISVEAAHLTLNGEKEICDPEDGVLDSFDATQFEAGLVNGTLEVKVELCVELENVSHWRPTKTLFHMSQMFNSKKHSDVTFHVGDRVFHAHRVVLAVRAPFLDSLVEDAPQGEEIPLSGIEPTIFHALLFFVYTGVLPNSMNLDNNAVDLLKAADKFECLSLKLTAEASLASINSITPLNAVDRLLMADSMNCAFLMERAIQFIVGNRECVMQSPGFDKLARSAKLMLKLFQANPQENSEYAAAIEDMPVVVLRNQLKKRGAGMDGSHEMLVKRLRRCKELDAN